MSVNSKMTAIADAIRMHSGKNEALTLDNMAAEIAGFHTFNPPSSDAMTPEEVYRSTRPIDWLPLPVPGDEEMFFLGHLINGIDNQFLIRLSFSGTCTIEFGNLVNGVFTAKETVTPVSDTMFYHALNYEDYGDETEEGHRQYIVRIAGSRIKIVRGGENVTDSPACIVEFVCGIPLQQFTTCGGQVNYNWNKTFASTRYIRFVGNGKAGIMTAGFGFASQLLAVNCQRKNDAAYASYAFHKCGQLAAVPGNLFPENFDGTRMFRECAISKLPRDNMTITDTNNMFLTSALQTFDGAFADTSAVQNFTSMFDSCNGLRSVENLNISALATSTNMFNGCRSLLKLTFAGDTTPGGLTINLTQTALSHTALVNMLSSLPTATNAATITITNNPGAAELSDEEIAVATAKNWTVTI